MKRTKQGTPSGRRPRRQFSAEFKSEAVRMMAERLTRGVSVAHVGRELDVRPEQLRAWARAEQQRHGAASAMAGETPEQELRRLRRENAVLRDEQAFAKNWSHAGCATCCT